MKYSPLLSPSKVNSRLFRKSVSSRVLLSILRFQKDGAREGRLDEQCLLQSKLTVMKPNAFYCPNKLDGHLLPPFYTRGSTRRVWGEGGTKTKIRRERGEGTK